MLARYIGDSIIREELLIFEVCQLYGWTYADYESNPEWFNDAVIDKHIIDTNRIREERERAARVQ